MLSHYINEVHFTSDGDIHISPLNAVGDNISTHDLGLWPQHILAVFGGVFCTAYPNRLQCRAHVREIKML